MSLIGGYRTSGTASGSACSDRIINFSGFAVSGLAGSNVLAVCMYAWDSSIDQWVPYDIR